MRKVIKKTTTTTHTGGPDSGKNEELKPQGTQSGGTSSGTSGSNSNAGGAPSSSGQAGASSKPMSNSGSDAKDSGNSPKPEKSDDKKPDEKANEKPEDEKDENENEDDADENEGSDEQESSADSSGSDPESDKSESADKEKGDTGLGKDGDDKESKDSEGKDGESGDGKSDKPGGDDDKKADDKSDDKGSDSKSDSGSGDNKSGGGDSGGGSKMDAAKDMAKDTGKAAADEAKSQASGGDGKETAEMAAKLAKSRADDAKKSAKEKADEADGKSDGKSPKDKAKEKAEKTDERMQDAAQLGAEAAAEAYGGEAGRKAAHAGINIARKSGLIELLKKWRKRIMAIIMAIKAAIAAAIAALIAYLIQMLMALIGALIQAIMQMFAWLIALIQLILKIIAVIQAVIAVVVAVVTAVVTAISTVGAVMAGTPAYDPGSYEDYVADPLHDCVAEYDDAYRALFGGNGKDEHGENQAFGVLSDMDKRWKNGTLDLKRTLESAQKVRSFFREYGLTDTQCAAIVGTLYDMSALDYTYVSPVDTDKYDNQWFCKPGETDTTTDWTGKDFAGTSPAKKWIQDYDFKLYDMNGQESASGPHGNYPLPQGSHTVVDPATSTSYETSNTTVKPSEYFATHANDVRAGIGIGAWRDVANTAVTSSGQTPVINDATRLLEFTKQLDTRVQGVEDAVDAAEAWQKDMKAERANRLAVIYGDFGLNADGTLDPGTWTNQPGSHLYTLAYGPSEETKNNNDYWAQKDPTIDLPWVAGTSKGYLPDGATQGIALQQQYKNYRDILGGNITDLEAAITTMLTYYTDTYIPSRDKIKGLNTDTADAFVVDNIREASASAPSGDLVTFTDEVLGPKFIGTLGDVTVDYRLADTSALTAYLATLDSTDNWTQLKLKYDPAINGANILDNESTNLMYSLEAQYRYWDRAYVNRNTGYDGDGWWRVRPYGIIVNDSLPMNSSTASQSESYFYKSDSSCVKIRYDFNNGLYGVDHSYKAMHDYGTNTDTYSIHDLLANYGRAEVSESNGQSDSANTIWKIDTPYSALANSNPELQGASGKSTIKSYLDEYLLSPDLIFTNGGNTYTINASCNEMYRGVTKYVRSNGTVASRLLGGDGNYDSSDSSYMKVLRGLSYNASTVSWSWAGSSSMHKGLFWDYSDNKLIWDVPNKSLSMVPNQWSTLDSIYHNALYKMSTTHPGDYEYTWWADGDVSHAHDADRAKKWKDAGGEAQGWSYQAAWRGNYTDDDYITAGGSSNWGYSIKYRNGTTGSWCLYNPADGTSKNVADLTISNHTSTDSRWSTFKSKADTYISNQKTKISDFKTDAVDYETKYHEMLDKIADVEAKADLVKKAAEDFNKCSKMLADARMDFYEADEDMYQATSRYVEDEIRDGIGKPSGTWYSDFAQHYKLANGSVNNWGDYEVKLYNLWQKYIKPYREGDEPEDGQYLHWYDLDVQLLFMINDDKYKDKFAEWKSGDERRNHGLDQETRHFRDNIILAHNGSIGKSTDSAFAFYYLFQYGSPYNLNIKEADKEGAAYKIVESWMEKTHPMYIQGFETDFSFGTATAADAVWNPYALQGYYGSTLLEAADDGYNHSKVNKLGELANTCAYVDVMDNSTFAKASLLLLDPNRAMIGVNTAEVSDLYKYVDGWIFGTNPSGYDEAASAIYQGHYGDPMRWILLAASWSGCDTNLITGRLADDFMSGKQYEEETLPLGGAIYNPGFTTKDLYDYLSTNSSKSDNSGTTTGDNPWNQREEYDMTKPSTMHHTDYTDTTNNRKGLKDRDDDAEAKNPDGSYKYKWAQINVEWSKGYDFWKKQLRPGDIIICNTAGGLTGSETDQAFFIWYGEDMINDFFPNLDYTFIQDDGTVVSQKPEDPAPGTWGSSYNCGPIVAGYKTPWYNKPSLCQLYWVQAKAEAEEWDVYRLVHPDGDTRYRNVAWDYMTRMQYEPSDYVNP